MKIYFDGCSYTEGKGYLGEDYKNLRWSKLLCDKLGAKEYNISDSGSCNQRMLRNLANEHCNIDYDLMVIQLSYPNRTEFGMDHTSTGKQSCVGSIKKWGRRCKFVFSNVLPKYTKNHMVLQTNLLSIIQSNIFVKQKLRLITLSCYLKRNYQLIMC